MPKLLYLGSSLKAEKLIFEVDPTLISSVQLVYFMISRPLKASDIKIGVKKKVEAAKRNMEQDMQDVCMAASPYACTMVVI